MEATESRRLTPFHRALHRPQQIMGGERELMLFSMLVAGGLIVSALNLVATAIGLVLWLICVHALRKMAKADPEMSKVYVRQSSMGTITGRFRGLFGWLSRHVFTE